MKNSRFETIFTLSAEDALAYFMSTTPYTGFELPEYFKFDAMFSDVQQTIGDKSYDECCSSTPETMPDVNLVILLNKDGGYGVRPLTLVNPYLLF